jgi:TRAP-type C4-dicarboxylate transport system permease small subunit
MPENLAAKIPIARSVANGFEKLGRFLEMISGGVCVACFVAMTLVVLIGVFFRYVLNDPFMWTEEAARYLQVWMGFVAVSIALKRDKHIKVDVLSSLAPAWLAAMAGFVVDIIIGLFMIILLKQGYLMTVDTLAHASTLPISMVWILAAVPVAAGLSLIHLLVKIINKILNPKPVSPAAKA